MIYQIYIYDFVIESINPDESCQSFGVIFKCMSDIRREYLFDFVEIRY